MNAAVDGDGGLKVAVDYDIKQKYKQIKMYFPVDKSDDTILRFFLIFICK